MALLLGALLAITDTVSVLLAFRSVRVPAPARGDHGRREPLQRRHRARARERRRDGRGPGRRRPGATIARMLVLAIVGGGAARRDVRRRSARWSSGARPTT